MERVEALYHHLLRRPELPPALARALKAAAVLVREVVRDQVHVRAATLAYWSLVAIVPVLVLAVATLRLMGMDAAQALFYRALLAAPVQAVGEQLDAWVADVDFAKLGLVGVLAAALAGSRIYFSVEEAYNRLWNVRVRRTLTTRVVLFYATVTLAPVLVAAGFVLTTRVLDAVGASFLSFLLPMVVTAVAFVGAIRALPDTTVRWGPALLGGAVSAALFETAKVAFARYVELVGAAEAAAAIYGSLALLPVFLIWLYVLWSIVLVGVEIAYVTQRFDDLLVAEERRLAGPHPRQPDAPFALQCLLVVAREFVAGNGPTPEPTVTHALHSDPAHVGQALQTLEAVGLLAASERGYLPTAPLDATTARDVLARYRAFTRPDTAADAPGGALVEGMFAEPALGATLAELARA